MLRDNSIRAFKENFFNQENPDAFPTLAELGFNEANIHIPPININENIIQNYHNTRDYPHIEGTSNMSVHLRFGTISIRQLISKTKSISENYLNELIWREFFMSILYHFPETVTYNFHRKYDKVEWRNDEKEFELWCKGQTGFPLVDAGMRELNETGFMHNRVRMVVANFLTKLLLIDWRWGEEYFAEKLLDFELSSNVGNWQWSAGTGVDAAPYFRIFNPQLQIERFDPDYIYIKKWINNYNENYLEPIVDYKKARELCINTFKKALYND